MAGQHMGRHNGKVSRSLHQVGRFPSRDYESAQQWVGRRDSGLQERVDYMLTQQVFGITMTQLTSLLARRNLYCSKHASGEHSNSRGFNSDNGNIWFERTEHSWNQTTAKARKSKCSIPQQIADWSIDKVTCIRKCRYLTQKVRLIETKTQCSLCCNTFCSCGYSGRQSAERNLDTNPTGG